MGISNKLRGFGQIWAFDNRCWLALTKIFFPSETLQIYRYKGVEILTDHAAGDANGARDVLTSAMYKRFLSKLEINGPANVLDLGANNGGFPLLLATSGIELKKVVSVEFNPRTFARLHFNLVRNLDCEVYPINGAVCSEARKLEVTVGTGDVSDSVFVHHEGPDSRTFVIDGFTLDDLCDRYFPGETVDVCKIDIEGSEFEIFGGAHHRSLSRCRYVIMEIHERDGRKAEEIIPIIESLGFERRPTEPGADPTVHFFVNNAPVALSR